MQRGDYIRLVLANTELGANDKLVLIALIMRSDTNLVRPVWPSVSLLMVETSLSRSSVLRSIRRLEDLNWVSSLSRYSDGRQQTSVRRLLVPASVLTTERKDKGCL